MWQLGMQLVLLVAVCLTFLHIMVVSWNTMATIETEVEKMRVAREETRRFQDLVIRALDLETSEQEVIVLR